MTTLSSFMSLFNEMSKPIGAIQRTPQNLMILVPKEKFSEYMKIICENNGQFQFLEQRSKKSIDIHLKMLIQNIWIFVTLRFIDFTSELLEKLKIIFPSSETFFLEILCEKESNFRI